MQGMTAIGITCWVFVTVIVVMLVWMVKRP